MKTYNWIAIGALTGFSQAPHQDARMVMASHNPEPQVDDIKHIGWLMPEVRNHVEEQPTNRWKRKLIERARAAASGQDTRPAPKGWSHAGSVEVHEEEEA